MKAKEVARGVYKVGLTGVNVFLIDAGDDLVLKRSMASAGCRRTCAPSW
jgi:hypothetical protein